MLFARVKYGINKHFAAFAVFNYTKMCLKLNEQLRKSACVNNAWWSLKTAFKLLMIILLNCFEN